MLSQRDQDPLSNLPVHLERSPIILSVPEASKVDRVLRRFTVQNNCIG